MKTTTHYTKAAKSSKATKAPTTDWRSMAYQGTRYRISDAGASPAQIKALVAYAKQVTTSPAQASDVLMFASLAAMHEAGVLCFGNGGPAGPMTITTAYRESLLRPGEGFTYPTVVKAPRPAKRRAA